MSRPPSDPRSLSDVIRDAIRASGVPLLRIEQETGVNRASISRFLRGERTIRLDVADKLATYLNLELTPADRPRAKRG